MAIVRAAGCVVWRYGDREPEVLLVHRPRYDDWSFPKGKLDRGEHVLAAAVREVEEETGVRARLGIPLPDQQYPVASGQVKHVAYWAARPNKTADVSAYEPNAEIDKVTWSRISKARRKLSYLHDRDLLDDFEVRHYQAHPLLIVRHASARNRRSWRHEDSERPLSADGKRQAVALIPLLRAYDVDRVVSSDALRCADTVLPFVNATRAKIKLEPALSEDGAKASRIKKVMRRLLDGSRSVAVCSHRPVLPEVFDAMGVEPTFLQPGEALIAHRLAGKVVAVELHRP